MTKPPKKPHAAKPFQAQPIAPVRGAAPRRVDRKQPQLPLDPMPERIEPCLALLKAKPPSGPDWAFEIKWDGYRLAVHVEPTGVRILTRGGHDWTERFPAIAGAALEIGHTIILDGEAVVLDGSGRSDFSLLQKALGGRGGKRIAPEATLYVFDLLYLDGHDIRSLPLAERRRMLESIVHGQDGPIRLSEEIEADGAALLQHACALGLEGIIAKNRDAPYRSGRGGEWLKIKCTQSESFAIIGYESSTLPGFIGALVLAARKSGELIHVGSVGTGFTHKVSRDLKRQLDGMRIERPAARGKLKGIVPVQPSLIAEVEFRGWTGDGKLRHASFKGMREVADAANICEIRP